MMETTTLGRGGPVVSRAGLGLMGMSGIYGQADDHESIVTIRTAIDAGITLLDTGDFYGMGHNELLRSEEHTSELQSLRHLVCRLLLEKKKKQRLSLTNPRTSASQTSNRLTPRHT